MFTKDKYDQSKLGGPEDGKRIDYIFYRSLDQRWRCDSACVTMTKAPGAEFPFSDHDGVEACFLYSETDSVTPGEFISVIHSLRCFIESGTSDRM